MITTKLVVTGGLVLICVAGMVTGCHDISLGALTALAGWLGGNSNGKRESH